MKFKSIGMVAAMLAAFGAGSASADELTWSDGATGNWSDPANWAEGATPQDGDSLSFGATANSVDDLTALTSIALLAKTGTGDATLVNLPGTLAIGKLSQAGGTFTLRWKDDTPPEAEIPASSALIGTLDLGGASLKDTASVVNSTSPLTLKNGTYTMTASFPDSAWNLTADEGTTLNVTGVIYAGQPAKQWKYLYVKNGAVINFTGTGTSVLGSWYNTRWISVSLSNGGTLNHANGKFWAGCSGTGNVTCDHSTLDVGEKEVWCTRISDNLDKAGKDYNGTANFTFKNGSVFRAGTIRYGYEGHTDGTFKLDVNSGSTLYVGSIVADGNTAASINFDDAMVVPTAGGTLFQDHADCTAARIHVKAGGLTVANSNAVDIALSARMDGAGTLTVQANQSLVTIGQPIECAGVTFENPGRIDLACEGAFPSGRQVTLRYTEAPTVGQVVAWTARPAGVTFVLAGDAAGGYELEEVANGLTIKASGMQPAANAYWTGAGEDPSNILDLANWELHDALDAVMERGYIDGSTICHFGGGALTFDLNGAFSCRALYIEGTAVLDADHDWTAATVPFYVTDSGTVDLNGHTLALSTLQNVADAHSAFGGASGTLVFDVAAGRTNDVVGLSLAGPAVLNKTGAGVLRLVDLAGQPVLKLDAGEVVLAWTSEPPANPFATTPVNNVKGTLGLGGATQTFAAGMGTIFQNGTVLLDGVYTTSNARWSWPSASEIYTVGAGAEVHSAGEWYQMNKQCPEFHVKNGGIFSYESTAQCKLGWRYNNRNGKIFLENGGVWRMDKADIGVGISGNGYLYVRSGSWFDAPTRNIALDAWYNSDVGYGYMEVVGGSRVDVKKLLFGQNGHAHGNARFIAKEDSLLCLEYMGPDGTATLPGGLNVSLEGVTIVPMVDTTLESPLLSDGQDYDVAKFHVNGAGLCVSNANEKTLAFDAKFDGAGPFEVKAFRQDIALASTLACTNVVLTDMRTMALAEGAQLAVEGGSVLLKYSNGQPVRCGKVIAWAAGSQPADVAFNLDEVTQRHFTAHVKADGLYIESGMVIFVR